MPDLQTDGYGLWLWLKKASVPSDRRSAAHAWTCDRQLNQTLHTIVLLRGRRHERTRRYVGRRIAEGKSLREIRRCLKRTAARQLFRLLDRQALPRVTA